MPDGAFEDMFKLFFLPLVVLVVLVALGAYIIPTRIYNHVRFARLAKRERGPRETISKRLAFVIGIVAGVTSHFFVLGLIGGPFYWHVCVAVSLGNGLLNIGCSRFIGQKPILEIPTQPRSGYELGLYGESGEK